MKHTTVATGDSPAPRIDLRYLSYVLIVAAAYIATAKLGFSLAFATKQVTAVWPPTGIAVAALLIGGYRLWPGIWIGAFVSNAFSNEPLLIAAGIATGNTLGPLFGVYLLRRFDFDSRIERLRDVLALVLGASMLAMTITATNGVVNLALAGIVPWSDWAFVWRLWWTGDAMGVLLFAPLILTWSARRRRGNVQAGNVVEAVALTTALGGAAWLSFMTSFPFAYPLYPLVIWTALRFGQRATTLAVAAISALAIYGTRLGQGPFVDGSLDRRLALLVMFMAVLALTGLVLGAVTAERRLARAQLEAAERRFQVLAETVPQMVWTSDATG
ncbi:MAG TPA: MASE1 domain-containing protein, partial [Candidatus Eremiobacteraceae bacterium]|nr:MASE1 domain-containing protein [Candidatus Eremiobacteraceae bacterium]